MTALTFQRRRQAADQFVEENNSDVPLRDVMEKLLTPNQLKIMSMLENGSSIAEIAKRLGVCKKTVWVTRNTIARHVLRAKKMMCFHKLCDISRDRK